MIMIESGPTRYINSYTSARKDSNNVLWLWVLNAATEMSIVRPNMEKKDGQVKIR